MASSLYRGLRPTAAVGGISDFVCHACRRHQSSYRRTSKALKVKPDAAFLPSKTEAHDHIIFNPPSSAPSVYHTPLKFLPSSDPRRRLNEAGKRAAQSASTNRAISSDASATTPISEGAATAGNISTQAPAIRPVYEKKYHLKQEDIEEMRRLRASDPKKWTRVKLAEKFECSQFFVSLCCAASKEVRDEYASNLEAIKAKWGRRKSEAREARQVRKKLWGRDA